MSTKVDTGLGGRCLRFFGCGGRGKSLAYGVLDVPIGFAMAPCSLEVFHWRQGAFAKAATRITQATGGPSCSCLPISQMKKWRPTQERGQPKICWARVSILHTPLEEAHFVTSLIEKNGDIVPSLSAPQPRRREGHGRELGEFLVTAGVRVAKGEREL